MEAGSDGSQPDKQSGIQPQSDYAPYPKIELKDIDPVPESYSDVPVGFVHSDPMEASKSPGVSSQKSVRWSPELASDAPAATSLPGESNPYISSSPAPAPAPSSALATAKSTMLSVRDTLGNWGKRAADATKKAEDLAGNFWQHLKTGPSFADAAMGRIAQGTKVLAEGGYEKIFHNTFEMVPGEKFQQSFACYLSTSAGPVMGILYLSTAKLAFCSDNPLSYKVGDRTEWSYYKVVIPIHQLRAITPSSNKANSSEKYIQVISVDNHEFWFMGFVTYENAVKVLEDALLSRNVHSV